MEWAMYVLRVVWNTCGWLGLAPEQVHTMVATLVVGAVLFVLVQTALAMARRISASVVDAAGTVFNIALAAGIVVLVAVGVAALVSSVPAAAAPPPPPPPRAAWPSW
jgi:hypothetical protein